MKRLLTAMRSLTIESMDCEKIKILTKHEIHYSFAVLFHIILRKVKNNVQLR